MIFQFWSGDARITVIISNPPHMKETVVIGPKRSRTGGNLFELEGGHVFLPELAALSGSEDRCYVIFPTSSLLLAIKSINTRCGPE